MFKDPHVHVTAHANSWCYLWGACMATSTKSLFNRSSSSLQLVFTGWWLWNSLSITGCITWEWPQTNPVWKHRPGTSSCVCVCVCLRPLMSSGWGLQVSHCELLLVCVHVCVFMWQGCSEDWLNGSSDEGVGLKQLSLSKCHLPSRITLQQFFKDQTKVSTVEPLSLTSFAGGSSVSRCTHTCAILWRAGSSVLAGAAEWTVGSPEALWAHVITVDSCGHITMTNIQWTRTMEVCRNIPSSLPSVKRHQAGHHSQRAIVLDLLEGVLGGVFFHARQTGCFHHSILSNWASFATVIFDLMGLPAREPCWLTGLALVRGQACLPFPFSRVCWAERRHSGDKFTLWTQRVWQNLTKRHKTSIQGSLCTSGSNRTSVPVDVFSIKKKNIKEIWTRNQTDCPCLQVDKVQQLCPCTRERCSVAHSQKHGNLSSVNPKCEVSFHISFECEYLRIVWPLKEH